MVTSTPVPPVPIRNSYWVLPGKVLAGENPSANNTEATRERLGRLLNAGVECFIDLTETGEVKRYDPELPFGIEYLRKPIKDHGIPAQRGHMAEILDCLHDALQSGRCVYVHCRAGIGRTGTVIGCFLVERGLTGEMALDELNRLWQHCERSQSWPTVPETDEQANFVRHWKARGVFDDQGQLRSAAFAGDAAGDLAVLRGGTGAGNSGGGAGAAGVGATGGAAPWAHLLVDEPSAGAAAGQSGAIPPYTARPNAASANAPSAKTAPRARGLFADPASVARDVIGPPPGIVPAPAPVAGSGLPQAAVSNSVEDADPLLDPEALAAAGQLRARFLGAFLGLAIGDAVAAATQFRRPGTFTAVGDMLGGGPFDLPRGAWSDDTAMALCLADSLLERNGFDARDQVERYRRWQQEGYLSATGQCVGITASSARAIAMAQWRRQAFAGSHDPAQLDPEPLSRVASAVLFFFATSGQAVEQATEAARTTCQAPAVLDACRSLARALHAALSGQPKATVLEMAALAAATPSAASPGPSAARGGGAAGSLAGVGRGALNRARSPAGLAGGVLADAGDPAGVGGSAAAAAKGSTGVDVRVGSSAPAVLAAAAAAFGATDNFRDAILYAVNLGGDSDVVAAVCGQLAGAYYGVKAIPTSWYNGLMQKELITHYADRLLAHAMLGMGG